MIPTVPKIHLKNLIINADDFGICSSVNKGIIECLLNGKVSDLSCMVNFEAFNASVDWLKSIGKINVGIHINLTTGRSLVDPFDSPLSDNNGLYFDLRTLTQKLYFNQINPAAIYKEIKAQFEKLLNRGFLISHVDSHRNIHLLPSIMRPLLNVISDLGLEVNIRMHGEEIGSVFRALWCNIARLFILKLLTVNCYLRTGYRSNIATIGGNFYNNRNPANAFGNALRVMKNSPSEVFEFPVHPGYYSNHLIRYDTYGQQREKELRFLQRNNDFDFTEAGINLVSFDDIISVKPSATPTSY